MVDSAYTSLLRCSASTGVPMANVLSLFSVLYTSEKIENVDLVLAVGISKKTLNDIKEELNIFFEPTSTATSLSVVGRGLLQSIVPHLHLLEDPLSYADTTKKNIQAMLEKHTQSFPPPKRDLDQFTATKDTVSKRAILLNTLADIRQKRVAFIGDDDFTSVAISHFQPQKVSVFDIDERVLAGIQKVAVTESCHIQTVHYDVFNTLPANLMGAFDVVFTDPPYTKQGMEIFLSRAIQLLDPSNQAARIYFCYGNADRAKERFFPIHQMVLDQGLMLRWVFDKFNRYTGAESIGSTSSLFICDVTPKTKPAIESTYYGTIYTNSNY